MWILAWNYLSKNILFSFVNAFDHPIYIYRSH